MPITFDCPHCSNPFNVPDEHAGKKARCKNCNNIIQVPTSSRNVSADGTACHGCGEPVLPNWNVCPSCQTTLAKKQPAVPAPPAPLPAGQAPLVQAGNDNVIKTTVNAPTHTDGSSGVVPGGGQPAISMGDGNVVKANIDQSTNVTHDQSVNVQGQYVAQQTVIHESSVSTIMKMLSSPFTNKDADKIGELIEALPDDKTELMELLRKSLLQLVRQMKVEYKEGKKSGFGLDSAMKGYGNVMKGYFSVLSFGLLSKVWTKKDIAVKRVDLCKKILDKLHDSAISTNDQEILGKLDELDDHLISLQSLTKKNEYLKTLKPVSVFFAVLLGLMFLALFGTASMGGPAMASAIFSTLFFAAITAAIFFYSWKIRKDFENEIKHLEKSVPQLLGLPNNT